MTPLEMIHEVAENWFLGEPPFYALYCMQQLQDNAGMECAVRVGHGRLEYNPLLLSHKNYREVEQLMRIEMIRLLLKHPYQRRPEGCDGEVISLGSDCTIADGYALLREAGALQGPGAYHLPIGQCYEWYCKEIARQRESNDDSGSDPQPHHNHEQEQSRGNNDNPSNTDGQNDESRGERSQRMALSALWEDDTLRQAQINDLIERTSDWGSLSGDIVEMIQASTRARLNRQMVMQGFKSQLLSPLRQLTRMRPNRRTGFIQMGNRRQTQARLLIAIDCSGSIDTETLQLFIGTVNRLLRDVDTSIDLMQFDAEILSIEPMTHTLPQMEVHGRGGTDFQPVIDYFIEHIRHYDAYMILTDGEAQPPHLARRCKPILWVCRNEDDYRQHHAWMEQSGRCCWL
ncbi:MAG: VWA-like domain-containing protein [Bacteroidales bacterium]|nr:VWA-like domain-containing protein [Bacteroidales bacterium]